MATTVLHLFDLSEIEPLIEAIPSLEEGVVALVHMLTAPEIYRLIFLVLASLLAIVSWLVCRAIENKKPALAKKNKAVGAAIGVLSGLIFIVAIMAPTVGYATEAPEIVHILGEYEQISHEGAEDMSEGALTVQTNAQKAANTPLLKVARALGGGLIFDSLTTVSVDGEETNLVQEFHAIDMLGEDIAVLTAVPIEAYTDYEYDTLKGVGEVFEQSVLLRVLGAETVSSLCRSWLKGEPFLMIGKPEMDDATGVALDAAMVVLKNTTKDTIAKDIRGLTPAVAAAIRTMNLMNSLNTPTTPDGESTEDGTTAPSTGGSLMDNLDVLVSTLTEELETEESKEIVVRAGIGLVAKELESLFVKKDDAPAAPSTPSTPSTDGGEGSAPADPETPAVPETPTVPDVPAINVPENTQLTQEEYDVFVEELTDLAVSGVMKEEQSVIVEEVKDIRDAIGIDIPDETLEDLVSQVMNSPFASLFQ